MRELTAGSNVDGQWCSRLLVPLLALVVLSGCDFTDNFRFLTGARGMAPGGMASLTFPDSAASRTADLPPPVSRDWDAIAASDTLRVLLSSNATTYFVYRGQPMGFEYELLERFAEDHDLELVTEVVRDPATLFHRLNTGQGDVAASRLVPIPEHREVVRFSRPLYETRPVVVQRDTAAARRGDSAALAAARARGTFFPEEVPLRARLIRTPDELRGDTVFVERASEYYSRIVMLEDSTTGDIELVEVASVTAVEDLIRLVNEGRIRLTVAPENITALTKDEFREVVAKPTMGPLHPVAWAMRTNAPVLQERIDEWLREQEEEGTVAVLYRKYFLDSRGYRDRVASGFLAQESGQISPFDSILRAQSEEAGWDWRLIAAQAYQESNFDPRARSWAGAQGLLQLMPATAREVGVSNPLDVSQNVSGALRYLSWLTDQWIDEIPDEAERLRFVLGSYNAGAGHVGDARRLAEKYGDDPNDWDDVAYWLLQKSRRRYYTDPVVRYGYVRGTEPVNYVSEIMARFRHYRDAVF